MSVNASTILESREDGDEAVLPSFFRFEQLKVIISCILHGSPGGHDCIDTLFGHRRGQIWMQPEYVT